jgi:hypothetical protein
MTDVIRDFITENAFAKCEMTIVIDDFKFMIRRKDVVEYDVYKTNVSHDVFMKKIESYIHAATVVCYSIKQPCKSNTDETFEHFVKVDYNKIKNLKTGDLFRAEIVKNKTYLTIVVDKMDDKYIFYYDITSLDIAFDSDDDFDDDRFDEALERGPIIQELIETVSASRIIKEINRLVRTVESEYDMISGISGITSNKCLMNLTNSEPRSRTIGTRYRSTDYTKEDMRVYTTAKEKPFHDELLKVTWDPCRYQKWCLDTEEEQRFSLY